MEHSEKPTTNSSETPAAFELFANGGGGGKRGGEKKKEKGRKTEGGAVYGNNRVEMKIRWQSPARGCAKGTPGGVRQDQNFVGLVRDVFVPRKKSGSFIRKKPAAGVYTGAHESLEEPLREGGPREFWSRG